MHNKAEQEFWLASGKKKFVKMQILYTGTGMHISFLIFYCCIYKKAISLFWVKVKIFKLDYNIARASKDCNFLSPCLQIIIYF